MSGCDLQTERQTVSRESHRQHERRHSGQVEHAMRGGPFHTARQHHLERIGWMLAAWRDDHIDSRRKDAPERFAQAPLIRDRGTVVGFTAPAAEYAFPERRAELLRLHFEVLAMILIRLVSDDDVCG